MPTTATTAAELPLQETIAPTDEAAVASVISAARRSGTPVYPIGGGTSLDYGVRPIRPGIGLDMSRMPRVLDHPADDLTITVEPGLTLAELNRGLAAKRQWLPIDAPQPGRATVGGIVATNACGPRRFGYGTVGDYLIGVRAIDGCGEAFAGGGRVVKNAAGYNLPRLLVGSMGTLGAITQLTFMVRPLPSHSALVICDVASFRQGECLLAALGRSLSRPTIVELLAGPAVLHCPLPPPPHAAASRLVVGFEGCAAEVQGMANVLCDEWRAMGADGLTTVVGAGRCGVELVERKAGGVADQRIAQPPGRGRGTSGGSADRHADPCPRGQRRGPHVSGGRRDGRRAGRVFAGRVCRAGARHAAADCRGGRRALDRVRRARRRGTGGGGDLGAAAPGAAVMRSIQQRFDPAGILNPGRVAW